MSEQINNTWLVRAGRGGRFYDLFREQGFVSLGWAGIGEIPRSGERSKLVDIVRSTYPEISHQSAIVTAGQLLRFARELKIGDRVVTYDSSARTYLCGVISGEYVYFPD